MVDIETYAEYKDSGVLWLEKVPVHWRVERAKWLFRKMDRPVRDFDEVITCFRDGVVTLRKNRRLRGFTESLKEIGYQGILKGDLVIHAMDAFAGAVGVADSDGKGTPVYSVCEPVPGVNAYYYAYIIREMSRSQWILALAKGIRERSTDFRYEGFASQWVPVPPPQEQTSIVKFLNYIDIRIRRYIRAKQRLIKLLNEQKQAIIHQAVTRGLDQNVRLKPSGVEWLGDVPEHWVILRSKFVFQEVDRRTTTGDEIHFSMSQKFGLVPSSMVEEKRLLSESYIGSKICELNDLVLNRLKAHLGVFALSPGKGLVSPDYTVLRPIREINPRYFEFILKTPACRVELRKRAKGIVQGFWRLYTDDFYDIRLPIPPVKEQEEIICHLDSVLDRINKSIESTNQKTLLIQEFRSRLIADIVTGKLDIRKAVRQLPEEQEELVSDEETIVGDEESLESEQDDVELVTEEGEE